MDDDEFIEDEDEGNADGWIVTYSDLMSLLLCFFVLILSMAEVDIIRYKQLADSMQEAFGVQTSPTALSSFATTYPLKTTTPPINPSRAC